MSDDNDNENEAAPSQAPPAPPQASPAPPMRAPRLNERILSSMSRRSVAAHPWHDLEIGNVENQNVVPLLSIYIYTPEEISHLTLNFS